MDQVAGIVGTTTRRHVLIVEDDPNISKVIVNYLEKEGYGASSVETVAAMRSRISDKDVSLVILDVGLPDEDGWSALRWLRARSDVPVVMLTGKSETVDRVIGLELGADDYIAKPFELRELLARLRSIWRRAEMSSNSEDRRENEIKFEGWILDTSSQQLKSVAGEIVHLTPAEYQILELFAKNPRVIITRDRLLDVTVGRAWVPFDRSIDVHISNLRGKLDPNPNEPSLIRTVRCSGYKFIPDRGV
jgi:DNA-binding response OmpR family regulator